jgi:hypothetical protein
MHDDETRDNSGCNEFVQLGEERSVPVEPEAQGRNRRWSFVANTS